MTNEEREEAIKQLKLELSLWESDCKSNHKTKDALKMAIKALQDKSYELWKESCEVEHQRNIRLEEKIKELEQEPCEDVISRKNLLNKLDPLYKEKIKIAPDNMAEGFMQVEKLIRQEPPVKPVSCIATVNDEIDYCYECTAYGDDYYIDEQGDLICYCPECPLNQSEERE